MVLVPLEPDAHTLVLGFLVRNTDLQYSGFTGGVKMIAKASFVDVTSYHRHGILQFWGGQDIPMGFFGDVF